MRWLQGNEFRWRLAWVEHDAGRETVATGCRGMRDVANWRRWAFDADMAGEGDAGHAAGGEPGEDLGPFVGGHSAPAVAVDRQRPADHLEELHLPEAIRSLSLPVIGARRDAHGETQITWLTFRRIH